MHSERACTKNPHNVNEIMFLAIDKFKKLCHQQKF